MKKILVLAAAVIVAAAVGLFLFSQSPSDDRKSSDDSVSAASGGGADAGAAAEACGVIREAFLKSSSSAWTFSGCSALASDHYQVKVWTAQQKAAAQPAVFAAGDLPPDMAANMCDLFFRSFDFIVKADFVVLGSDRKSPVMIFNLDRRICSSSLVRDLDSK
ncbi:MAG: hypothetical protein IJ523_05075 [Succinivibrionaceae bacterium]|nr:hypothetical protein [Succinivibrionaceae bacterium]